MAPRSLYVHIPFCRHRCGYCNFSLVAGRDAWIDRYLEALAKELHTLPSDVELETLYLGGGTPSHLSDAQFHFVFDQLDQHVTRADDCEVTIECNPIDVDQSFVDVMLSRGVNRVSLGVQSFDDDKLAALDRDHSSKDVADALDITLDRIPNLSVDLIFGIRDESTDRWQTDVTQALSSGATHLSTYGLTIEKGTRFFNDSLHGRPHDSDEETSARMYELTCDLADRHGFEHYEISSFARPGSRSRHNSIYWSGRDYFAIGSGAACYLNGVRKTNHHSPMTYTRRIESNQSPVEIVDQLPPEDRARELLVIGMRRLAGVDLEEFETLTGYPVPQLIAGRLDGEIEAGLVELGAKSIKLTPAGLLLSDSIWGKIL